MQDYLRFLMAGAEDTEIAETYHRCYCEKLHEYQEFAWFDDGHKPHIITNCDAFIEHEEEDSPTASPQAYTPTTTPYKQQKDRVSARPVTK